MSDSGAGKKGSYLDVSFKADIELGIFLYLDMCSSQHFYEAVTLPPNLYRMTLNFRPSRPHIWCAAECKIWTPIIYSDAGNLLCTSETSLYLEHSSNLASPTQCSTSALKQNPHPQVSPRSQAPPSKRKHPECESLSSGGQVLWWPSRVHSQS
jgi:hypothetical protein